MSQPDERRLVLLERDDVDDAEASVVEESRTAEAV
jgi:hypothetical protein